MEGTVEMTLACTEEEGVTVIRIAGKGTVHSAEELHAALAAAFAAPGGVVLDARGVTEIDAAFAQLLCSAGKSAAAFDKAFRLEGGALMAQRLAQAGIPAGGEDAMQSEHGGNAQ